MLKVGMAALISGLLAMVGQSTAFADASPALADTAPAFADTSLAFHVPVLMYHRIQCPVPGQRMAGDFICPAQLDAQITALVAQGWHTITADQLAQDISDGVCPGAKTLVVTIDDGALDGYTNAAPIFEAHGLRASFAMVPGRAGDYLLNAHLLKPHFSWTQARDLIARGFDVINHTEWHLRVRNDTEAELYAEVQAAQNDIWQHLGYPPKVFVYPFGAYGTLEQPYLASRFVFALTDPGAYGAKSGADETTDPMHAPRIRVSRSTTPARLAKRLSDYSTPC